MNKKMFFLHSFFFTFYKTTIIRFGIIKIYSFIASYFDSQLIYRKDFFQYHSRQKWKELDVFGYSTSNKETRMVHNY